MIKLSKKDLTLSILKIEYNKLKNIEKIARKYHTTRKYIKDFAQKNNIILENLYTSKIKVNENFFSQETPEVFYWAGFIAADGCINENIKNNTFCLQIGLAEKDLNHLIKFKKIIKSKHKLLKVFHKAQKLHHNDTYSYSIRIGSKKIINDLKKFNIGPRKSLTYKMPIWLINHPLIIHFIRGYFDGDGCIYIPEKVKYPRKTPNTVCTMMGTYNFLMQVHKIFVKFCKIKKEKDLKSHGKIKCARYDGNPISNKILFLLYDVSNKNIRLDRKYKKYQKCKNLLKLK